MARLVFWLVLFEALLGLAVSDAFASLSHETAPSPPITTVAAPPSPCG